LFLHSIILSFSYLIYLTQKTTMSTEKRIKTKKYIKRKKKLENNNR